MYVHITYPNAVDNGEQCGSGQKKICDISELKQCLAEVLHGRIND